MLHYTTCLSGPLHPAWQENDPNTHPLHTQVNTQSELWDLHHHKRLCAIVGRHYVQLRMQSKSFITVFEKG